MVAAAFVLLASVTVLLVVALLRHPDTTTGRGGKLVAFVALCLLPSVLTYLGTDTHLTRAKTNDFCLSCHSMEPYGKSLYIDDSDYLPAVHFQNRQVPRETACYTCHTQYTMFGDFQAKVLGLKHLWVHYSGQTPETIELYAPYKNRECLSCHSGARSYAENDMHVDILAELASSETSCLECHEWVHGVDELEDLAMWKPSAEEGP